MSQEVVSQKIKRTCDGCGSDHTFELVGPSENDIRDLQNWYTVIREVFVDARPTKIMVQACTLACVPAAAVKLALPTVAEPDEIDLASLRQSKERVN